MLIDQMLKEDRKRYLQYLRDGAPGHPRSVQILSDCTNNIGDQGIQKAALGGLSKQGTTEALLAIGERLTDNWGMGAITSAINICFKTFREGGLVLINATLFSDNRFINEKLEVNAKALRKLGKEHDLEIIENLINIGNYYAEPAIVNEYLQRIQMVNTPDIKWSVIFGSQFEGILGWQGRLLQPCLHEELEKADEYVESRIPGLKELFTEKLGLKSGDVK